MVSVNENYCFTCSAPLGEKLTVCETCFTVFCSEECKKRSGEIHESKCKSIGEARKRREETLRRVLDEFRKLLRVGGRTDDEPPQKKLRIDDALAATEQLDRLTAGIGANPATNVAAAAVPGVNLQPDELQTILRIASNAGLGSAMRDLLRAVPRAMRDHAIPRLPHVLNEVQTDLVAHRDFAATYVRDEEVLRWLIPEDVIRLEFPGKLRIEIFGVRSTPDVVDWRQPVRSNFWECADEKARRAKMVNTAAMIKLTRATVAFLEPVSSNTDALDRRFSSDPTIDGNEYRFIGTAITRTAGANARKFSLQFGRARHGHTEATFSPTGTLAPCSGTGFVVKTLFNNFCLSLLTAFPNIRLLTLVNDDELTCPYGALHANVMPRVQYVNYVNRRNGTALLNFVENTMAQHVSWRGKLRDVSSRKMPVAVTPEDRARIAHLASAVDQFVRRHGQIDISTLTVETDSDDAEDGLNELLTKLFRCRKALYPYE